MKPEEILMADPQGDFDDGEELTKFMEQGMDGRPRPNAAKITEAKNLVDYWVGKATGAKWPTLDKAKVLNGLKDRIDKPDRIYQHKTSLCGVASFVRELAWDDPVQYGRFGALLYEGGWATLGKGPVHPLVAAGPILPHPPHRAALGRPPLTHQDQLRVEGPGRCPGREHLELGQGIHPPQRHRGGLHAPGGVHEQVLRLLPRHGRVPAQLHPGGMARLLRG